MMTRDDGRRRLAIGALVIVIAFILVFVTFGTFRDIVIFIASLVYSSTCCYNFYDCTSNRL